MGLPLSGERWRPFEVNTKGGRFALHEIRVDYPTVCFEWSEAGDPMTHLMRYSGDEAVEFMGRLGEAVSAARR